MRVTFLGTADGSASATRDHSGLLIQTPESSLLLDCGASASRYLLQKKISPDVPTAIWISHMHSDHIGQLGMLIQSLWLRARRAPLHLYAPEAVVPVLKEWFIQCLLFPELIGFRIEWHPVRAGRKFQLGVFALRPLPTRHLANLASYFQSSYPQTCFDCHGVSIVYRKERYIYSADLEHPRDIRSALRSPARALFCELTHFPERDFFQALAQSQVKGVWITHYPDQLRNKAETLRRVAREEGYRGAVNLMRDKQSVVI